jgi:hypothetical protein
MTRFLNSCAFAFAVCAALTGASARATTLFSNLPATVSLSCDGSSYCGDQGVAGAFTPGGNFTLLDVVIPVANILGNDGAVVDLLSDDAGAPGSVLEQWTVTPPAFSGGVPGNFTLDDVDSVRLLSGDQYWIAVLPEDSSSLDVVFTPGTGTSDFYSGGSWQPVSGDLAFEVDGTAVSVATPEPGTICLLGMGLAAIGMARRRGASL